MNEKEMYLRPNVVFEPLFDNWYAWSHLISPATAAMNILGRKLSKYLEAQFNFQPHQENAAAFELFNI